MKFTVKREFLLKPLRQVIISLSDRQILSILNNLLIQVTDETLSITSTDLEIEVVAYITLYLPYDKGATTVPARKFFDICRSFSEGSDITVQLSGNRILINSGQSRFLVSTIPAKNFPNLNDWQSQVEFNLSQIKIKHVIEATQFSMACQDIRLYLNGMLFEIENGELRTVATDGHRLAFCSTPISNKLPNYSVIVPRKGVIGMMRMLDNSDMMLHVKLGNNNISFQLDNFIFTSKLINSDFPDYRQVLPKNPNKILEVNRDILKQAFTRAAILTNKKSCGVRLYVKNNQLRIVSYNHEQEESEEILNVNYLGKEIEISFNINYVLDILNALRCENVRILLTDSVSSIRIEDASSQTTASYILMPMRF